MYFSNEFSYDGILGSELGLSVVLVSDGMTEINLGIKQNIIEEKIPSQDKPIFHRVEKEPLSFTVSFAKINEDNLEWSYEERKKIVELFFQGEYKSLIFNDTPELIYYCMPVNDPKLFLTGLQQGYATITFRCNAPYPYSPTYIYTYDYQINSNNIIEINNLSNVNKYYYPEIQVELINSTSFSIVNLSNGGEKFEFTGLQIGEKIYVDNSTDHIETSLSDTYRLSNCNKNWLKLVKGNNRLQINGNIRLSIRCVYPIAI